MKREELETFIRQIVEEYVNDEVIGIDEAAKMLGYTRKTLYNKVSQIPHTKLPSGKLQFKRNEIIRYLHEYGR